MLQTVLNAVRAALHVPLYPAPARLRDAPCAIYRYYPGFSDGARREARLTVRVFADRLDFCAAELEGIRRALVADGDLGPLPGIVVRENTDGALSGGITPGELSYMQGSFTLCGDAH